MINSQAYREARHKTFPLHKSDSLSIKIKTIYPLAQVRCGAAAPTSPDHSAALATKQPRLSSLLNGGDSRAISDMKKRPDYPEAKASTTEQADAQAGSVIPMSIPCAPSENTSGLISNLQVFESTCLILAQ